MDKLLQKSYAHTRYYTKDETLVPGSTTITGLLAKPALILWANRMGLKGIDTTKYTDEAAAIGTLIHAMVEAHVTGKEMDTSDYSANQIELAKVGFDKYLEWEKAHKVEPIMNEQPFISEKYRYGGTLDFYCKLDGIYTLIDFKTGKGIYPEHFLQVSSYANLLRENDHKVARIIILNIGRNEEEPFQTKEIEPKTIARYFNMFKHLLKVYELKKELNWE